MESLEEPQSTQAGPLENVSTTFSTHPAWQRLEDQISWYDQKSLNCQWWYKRLKIAQTVTAVSIPTMNLLPVDYSQWAVAISATVIALCEGVQQLNQYSQLWVTYRATAEHLKHEKYLFLSHAGPFRDLSNDERLIQLSERVEEHVSTEHANWFNEARRNNEKKHEEKSE